MFVDSHAFSCFFEPFLPGYLPKRKRSGVCFNCRCFFSPVQFASAYLVDQRQTGNRVLAGGLKEAYTIAAAASECQDTCQHVGREGRCHDMQTLDCVRKVQIYEMRLLVAWLGNTQAIT